MQKLRSASSEIQFDCLHERLMRIPWPCVCTSYMVNLNHLYLTRSVYAVAARWVAHLLALWREMEMHTSSVMPRDEAKWRKETGGKD